ncbi:hypothetical protein EDC01DRAFT_633136 [Geopyxis carbonaria]|nr:hypothetical protein EDC01DRAFT_633136 [Geopyxis carbonaria]
MGPSRSATASTQLYAFAAFNALSSTAMLLQPTALCSNPLALKVAEKTGLDVGAPSLGWQVPLALQMYILSYSDMLLVRKLTWDRYGVALLYFCGARNGSREIRTCAMFSNMIFAAGTLLAVALRRDINGGVPLLMMGVLHGVGALWMALDTGTAELVRFVQSGMRAPPASAGVRKKAA